MRAQPIGRDAQLAAFAEMTRGFDIRDDSITPAGQPAIALHFVLKPETADRGQRLVDATKSALERLVEWHGPFPAAKLTVIDLPWNSEHAGVFYPGVVVTTARLFEPPLDRSLERTLIAAIVRQYWQVPAGATAAQRGLGEGLALYAGVRGIHEELEGRHFATTRVFGGFVPFTSRSIQWSPAPIDPRPRIRHFAEVPSAGAEAERIALALHSLERYLGWPSMQLALEALQARWRSGPAGPADLAAIVSEQRGRDMRWFFDEAFRFDARFDYGVVAFSSEADGAGQYQTRVLLRRFGDGVFSGTANPSTGPFKNARSLPVVTRFSDGTTVDDWWDGRAAELELKYAGPVRAVSTSVDPEAMLLLDDDRSNNTRAPGAVLTTTGARLAASWMLWLQDVMLATTALL